MKARSIIEIKILDGAIATMLFDRGMRFDDLPEDFMLIRPEVLAAIHREYRLAGADILTTNTFNLTRIIAENLDLHDRAEEIIKCAVELARTAGEGMIAGSIGPTSGGVDTRIAKNAFSEQARMLDSEGVDMILIETITSLDEALLSLRAVKSASGLPVIVNMTFFDFEDKPKLNPEESAASLAALGPSAIGANCGGDPRDMIRTVEGIRRAWPGTICAEPSAGMPSLVNERLTWPVSADEMAEIALQLVHAGAGLIGSCCGSTPEYTSAIARAIRR